jgi:hypothetical protein
LWSENPTINALENRHVKPCQSISIPKRKQSLVFAIDRKHIANAQQKHAHHKKLSIYYSSVTEPLNATPKWTNGEVVKID